MGAFPGSRQRPVNSKLLHRQYSLDFANRILDGACFETGMRPDYHKWVSKDWTASYFYRIFLIRLFKKIIIIIKQNPWTVRESQLTSTGIQSALNKGYYKVREMMANCGRSENVSPLNVKDPLQIIGKHTHSKLRTSARFHLHSTWGLLLLKRWNFGPLKLCSMGEGESPKSCVACLTHEH